MTDETQLAVNIFAKEVIKHVGEYSLHQDNLSGETLAILLGYSA